MKSITRLVVFAVLTAAFALLWMAHTGKLNGGGESLNITTGDGSIRLNRS